MKPAFDENGLAIEAGNIRCFYYCPVTGEYTGFSDEYINVGVSMLGNSTDIDPGDEVAGKVAIFTDKGWQRQEDHRGETVYSVEDKSSSVVDYIGTLKDGFVTAAPVSLFDKWDRQKWVTDVEAQHAAEVETAKLRRQSLLNRANQEIAWQQDAVDVGIATEEETAALSEWKKYRVLLMRVDTAKPVWPTPPGEQAS